MTEFSILICTCNPELETLERVLNSCASQNFDRSRFEIVLVDNNSATALSQQVFIRDLIAAGTVKLIEEKKQGLAYARITGAKAGSGNTFVFADDDNILNTDYLSHLSQLIREFPQVAAWGPGEIQIEYKGEVPAWVKNNYAWLFQEKRRTETKFGSVAAWPDYYPAGSGLSISRAVMTSYTREFESGRLTLTGRNGKILSSGEDSQIVWTAVKMGLSAGTSPVLKLTHVIPQSRTSLEYLSALNYGIAYSYATALTQMFPEKKESLRNLSLPGKLRFMARTMIKARFHPLAFYRFYTIENSWFRGIEKYQKQKLQA